VGDSGFISVDKDQVRGLRMRLDKTEQWLDRLAADPVRHARLISDLQTLREQLRDAMARTEGRRDRE
jgi:hypothetical protein